MNDHEPGSSDYGRGSAGAGTESLEAEGRAAATRTTRANVRSRLTAFDAEVRALVARGQHRRAAEHVHLEFGARVYDYLRGALLRDEPRASRAYAEFYRRLPERLPEFSRRDGLTPWIFRLARSEALRSSDGARESFHRNPTADASEVPLRAPPRSAERRRLECAKSKLTRAERELFVLRFELGLSWDDIAVILDEAGAPSSTATWARRYAHLVHEKLPALYRSLPNACGTGNCGCA